MNLLRLFVAGLLLAPLLSQPATAQVLDPSFTSPTGLYAPGTVYALGPQQADGKRLVAGTFSRVNGVALSSLVRLDAAGATDQAFSQNIGMVSNVYRVRSYNAAGQYLLGANGGGVTAGGISRAELLRLNANGTADASFDTGSGPSGSGAYVQEYAVQPDGKVVVTGPFDTFNSVTAHGVARLNANGSVDTGFNVGTGLDSNDGYGYAVAVQADGKILVGGDFTTFNGQPANGLVRLNTNGSLDASFSLPSSIQYAYTESLLIQPDGKILASGSFSTANGNYSLVRLLASGSFDSGFSSYSSANGYVSSNYNDQPILLQPDGKILAVGLFNPTSTTTSTGVARFNADGTPDASFQAITGAGISPYTLGLQANGTVLIGGSFPTLNGMETPLGRFTSVGAPDLSFAPIIQAAGSVTAMVRQADGKVIIGGNFTELNGQPVHRLARLSAAGVLEASFSASTGLLPATVSSLALQPDGKVVVGTGRGVLRFNTGGSPDTGFGFFIPVSASALALQADGRVLVGGSINFSTGGNTYSGLIRLNTNGSHDPTFVRAAAATSSTGSPSFTDAVLVQPDGKIVVGGLFRTSGTAAITVGRVVRYETTGALDATFNNTSAFTNTSGTSNNLNRIYALALQPDGKILAGGNFGAVDGTLHYGVARLSTTGVPDAGFVPNALLTGTVYSVARQPNGRVLLGGSFSNSAATGTLTNLVRVLDNGQTDTSFGNTAAPSGTTRTVLVQPDGGILLAGAFQTVGNLPASGVARISASNVLAVAAPAAVAARTAAWPVPAHGLLHIAPDLSAHPLAVELLDALGRPVRSQPMTNAPETTLDLASLPAGVYVLRVSYAAGAVTRRVVVQ